MSRNWQFIPSRNRVYCNGRCITGQNISVFLLALFLIIVTAGLFFAFDCPYLAVKLSPTIPIFAGLLFLFALGCIFRTACSDPGILPRATAEEIRYLDRLTSITGTTSNVALAGRVIDVQMVNGPTIRLKYCATCQLFRPPRVSHCSICNACIANFDHHCPWVGNCVGLRNYRYFYLFLCSLSLLCLYIFAFNIVNFALRSQEKGTVADAIRDTPATLVEAIICFFSLWSVIGLWGYHSYLICRSVTTNEDIKDTWASSNGNPFSRGNLFVNCFSTLCGPLPPSFLNLRSKINESNEREGGGGGTTTFIYHSDDPQQMTNGKSRVWNSSENHRSIARDFV